MPARPTWRARGSASATSPARMRGRGSDQADVHAGIPQPARCDRAVRLSADRGGRAGRRQVHPPARAAARRPQRPHRARRRGARNGSTDRGYDKLYGARPMGRLVQEKIKQPLAEELLFGKLVHGGEVKVRDQGQCARRSRSSRPRPKPPSAKRRCPTRRRKRARRKRRPERRHLSVSPLTPSPRRGEGWGEGARRLRLDLQRPTPPPDPPPQGGGLLQPIMHAARRSPGSFGDPA